MRLFHFSDDGSIELFAPRPVRTPSTRPLGMERLNGPLVWAIDELHAPMFFFPRECPRILLWRKEDSTAEDIGRYWGNSSAPMLAFIEARWRDRVEAERLWRYELPCGS